MILTLSSLSVVLGQCLDSISGARAVVGTRFVLLSIVLEECFDGMRGARAVKDTRFVAAQRRV
jgi:hypothetical protein